MAGYINLARSVASQTAAGSVTVPIPSNIRWHHIKRLKLLVSVTADATAAGDTLTIRLQHRVPKAGGSLEAATPWIDFAATDALAGDAGASTTAPIRTELVWHRDLARTAANSVVTSTSDGLAAGTVLDGPIGDEVRVRETIAETSAASFTYDLDMWFEEE